MARVTDTQTRPPGPAGRRERILQLLRSSTAPRSIHSLAEELHVHPNTVRFHLDGLLRSGQVEQLLGEPDGRGRPPTLFRPAHRMDPAGPTSYRLLAGMLAGHLAAAKRNPAAEAADIGRVWGPRLVDADTGHARISKTEALARIGALLADIGFAPEPPAGARARTIRLRHCPFLDLVDDHREVICALHLGLMQGGFDALHSPVTVERLDPLVEPDLCVAHLARAGARG